MAIQPVDLSTVYSQMDKMGQLNASQTQAMQFSNRQYLDRAAEVQTEKSQSVQETAKDKDSSTIQADVSQGGGSGQDMVQAEKKTNRKNTEKDDSSSDKPKLYEIKDPRLGNRLDIIG